MAKKAKVQRTKPTICPVFEVGRNIGGYGEWLIVADGGGKLWRIDCSTGDARPIKFAE